MVIIKGADFMKPKNKLMNKKGIFSGLGEGIKSVIDIIPKPIKIALFLLMILLLGNVFNFAIRSFGIHCNSGGTPVKVTDIIKNIELIGATPDYDNLNLYGAGIGDNGLTSLSSGFGLFEEVKTLCSIKVTDPIITHHGETDVQIIGDYWFYDENPCQHCPDDKTYTIWNPDPYSNLKLSIAGTSYCYGNVYRTNISWLAKTFMCSEGFLSGYVCRVPEHYYFDYVQNLYICLDESCRNVTIGDRWNYLLENAGAKPLYPESINITDEQGMTRALGITCSELRPRLTIFTIDIFNYIYWVMAIVIAVLVWVAINLKKL